MIDHSITMLKELLIDLRSIDQKLRINQGRDTEIAVGELCHEAADLLEELYTQPILEQKEVYFLQTVLHSLQLIRQSAQDNNLKEDRFLDEIENFV